MREGLDYVWRMVRLHPERRGQRVRVINNDNTPEGLGYTGLGKVSVEFEDGFQVSGVHRSGIRRIRVVEGGEEP